MQFDATTLGFLVPIVTVIVQLVKVLRPISERPKIVPFVAIGIGLAVAAAAAAWRPPAAAGSGLGGWAGFVGLHGLIAGLVACGVYSAGGKKALQTAGKLLKSIGGVL